MEVNRIRECLGNSLSVFWGNAGYTCSRVCDTLWVVWGRGTRQENCIGLEGNHDLDKFYPDPSQLSHVIDTEHNRYCVDTLRRICRYTPGVLSRPGRLVKFVRGEVVKWVLVLDRKFEDLPDVGLATELAITAVESEGMGAEDVWVVI